MTDPNVGTTELDQSYLETVTYHDREFQKYSIDNGIYFGPIDDEEIERLDIEQRVFNRVFDERLVFPPVPQLTKVLECGYGSGTWATEVAELYEECEVIGLDISPHMRPDDMPDNLWLQVDNLNRHFTFPAYSFDLVHSRLVAGGLNKQRWLRYVRDIARVLKSGGWAQMIEIYFNVQSDNGSLTENHALRRWSKNYIQALDPTKDVRIGMRLKDLMLQAGLEDVEIEMIPLPLCAWSNDPRMRDIGSLNRENAKRFLASMAVYPFTEELGMSRGEMEELVSEAQQEAADPSLRAYVPLYVCIGRKP